MTDPMRERLRALAEKARGEDDVALSARIEQRMRAQGPSLVRGARRLRLAVRVTGGALLAAAAVLLAIRIASPTPMAIRIHAGSRHVAVGTGGRETPAGWIPARACESERITTADPSLALIAAPDGTSRAELGVALVVAQAGSRARIAAREPCRTRVALDRGELAVHARALGGGTLSVTTPLADVIVHGTIFAVAVDDHAGILSLRVSVAEGIVSVERDGTEVGRVRAGGSLVLGAPGASPVESALMPEEADAIRHALGLATAGPAVLGSEPTVTGPGPGRGPHAEPAEPAGSPGELARLADARWRTGARDEARSLFVRAGAGRGADAEGAWISLARHELSGGQPRRALEALTRRSARFANGALDVDARWLEVQARVAVGDLAGASRTTEALARAHPGEPQVAASRALLARARSTGGGAP